MVVTSPSYFGLRQYAGGTENDLGREKNIELYVKHLLMAMREVRRVLRNDGVVFLNLGDTYHGSGRGAGKNGTNDMKMNPLCSGTPLRGQGKVKSLCLIPHRVMIALENDGWTIRNDIIWEKPNAVPESVKDRCTSSYEHVIIMTKRQKYFWNRKEAREPSVCWEKGSLGGGVTASQKVGKMAAWTMRHSNKVGSSKTEKRLSTGDVVMEDGSVKWHPVGVGPKGDALISDGTHGERTKLSPPIGNTKHQALGKPTLVGHRFPFKPTRNLRDVWSIPTMPHKEKHIAMFPEQLVERCIRIGSKEGDVVLDPFAGSGTTGIVARQLRRNAVLLDISEEYCQLMQNRLSQQPEPFESLPVRENKAKESSGGPMLDCDPCLPQPLRTQTILINQEFTQWSRTYCGSKVHAALCDTPYGLHWSLLAGLRSPFGRFRNGAPTSVWNCEVHPPADHQRPPGSGNPRSTALGRTGWTCRGGNAEDERRFLGWAAVLRIVACKCRENFVATGFFYCSAGRRRSENSGEWVSDLSHSRFRKPPTPNKVKETGQNGHNLWSIFHRSYPHDLYEVYLCQAEPQ